MKHLIVIGIGGFPRELFGYAKNSLGYGVEWDFKGYLDGNKLAPADEYEKLQMPVLGDVFSYQIEEDDAFVCAVGKPQIKKLLVDKIAERGGKFMSVIHNSAIIHEQAKVGQGVILAPHTIVNSCVVIGNHVTLQYYATVGHDASVGEFSSIMAHVSITGHVQVGELVYIGDSANVLPHAQIGNEAFVGASSLVLRRVKANDKVFGVPAMSII